MASNIAISVLKNGSIPEKEVRRFLGYLPQEYLKEYLSFSKIYNGKRNRSKLDLIDMIINYLFDVLPNFPFTTSETMDDHYL